MSRAEPALEPSTAIAGAFGSLVDWISRPPIGTVFEEIVDWLTDTFPLVFDGIDATIDLAVTEFVDTFTEPGRIAATVLLAVVAAVALVGWVRLRWRRGWLGIAGAGVAFAVLLFAPLTYFVITVLALVALWLRGWGFAVFAWLSLAIIERIQLWTPAMESLSLVLVAAAVALVIAVPIGVFTAKVGVVSKIVRPVLDFMQTMPAFVYLIPAIIFFSVGVVPGAVATIVFAMPPGVRLTELGIRQVDEEMVEAGEAFGSSPRQILSRIQVPLALPTIMAGVNQVIMLALSMVVIAGIVGAGGLGGVVFESIARIQIGTGFEAGLAVVILAIYLDRLTGALGNRSAVARAERAANQG